MIYPNKHTQFEESIIFKMLHILEYNFQGSVSIPDLYSHLKHKFDNIDEFIYSLDLLYVMDVIEVDFENNTIDYAKSN